MEKRSNKEVWYILLLLVVVGIGVAAISHATKDKEKEDTEMDKGVFEVVDDFMNVDKADEEVEATVKLEPTAVPTEIPRVTATPTPAPTSPLDADSSSEAGQAVDLVKSIINPKLEAWQTYFAIFAYNSEAAGPLPYYEALPSVRESFQKDVVFEYVDGTMETCDADTNEGDEYIEPGTYVYKRVAGVLVGYLPIEDFRREYGEPVEEDIFVIEPKEEPIIPNLRFSFENKDKGIRVSVDNLSDNSTKVYMILFRDSKIVEISEVENV